MIKAVSRGSERCMLDHLLYIYRRFDFSNYGDNEKKSAYYDKDGKLKNHIFLYAFFSAIFLGLLQLFALNI